MSRGASILIVDDDHEMGRYLTEICADAGYSAVHLADAREVLPLLAQGSVDLVVSDVQMPRCDGIELITKIRQRHAGVAVLAITAFGSVQTAARALRAGAYDYLAKPFAPDTLLTKVGRALQRRDLSRELACLRQRVDVELGKK